MAQLVRAPPCHGGGREFESLLGRLWGLSSAGRASALQAEGHRFEPCRPHLKNYGWIPEWPKGADCKSVGNAFEGSNPSPSIDVERFSRVNSLLKPKRFESFSIQYADVAQLAEQLICNQQVIGSSPIIGFVSDRGIELI